MARTDSVVMKHSMRSLAIGLSAFLVVAVACGDQLERDDAPSELSVRDIAEVTLAPQAVVDSGLDDLSALLDGLDRALTDLDRALSDTRAAVAADQLDQPGDLTP